MLSLLKKLTTNAIPKMAKKQLIYFNILKEYLLEIVMQKVKNQTKKVNS
jgi:hypothetical protein